MNVLLNIIGGLFIVRGIWLIPTSEREARCRQAPYRALRGAIYVGYGFALIVMAVGVRALVVVAQ